MKWIYEFTLPGLILYSDGVGMYYAIYVPT